MHWRPVLLRRVLVAVTGIAAVVAVPFLARPLGASAPPSSPPQNGKAVLGDYVLLGWNDLGMHCSNKIFADLAILPPYNNVFAQLVKRGDSTTPPQLMNAPYTVSYGIENNTFSVGKTDFWTYAQQLFGVALPPDIGLTGKGLSGAMDAKGTYYEAEGVPVTAYNDSSLTKWYPYQLAALSAQDDMGRTLASTEIVVPISHELRCDSCHVATRTYTTDQVILRKHDAEEGTNLMGHRPVLCAACHADNALGLPGKPGVPSLSEAMHDRHGEVATDCYRCHPGPVTQCLRDVMSQQHGMTCQDCHGSTKNVAETIKSGRQPWLQETPRCGTCHGSQYAEIPGKLFKESNNGHGGLYCSACHSSPHAILPSREERDNRQNIALQDSSGTLRSCFVCHGYTPSGAGPHGLFATGTRDPQHSAAKTAAVSVSPNPSTARVQVAYRTVARGPITLEICDATGRVVRTMAHSSDQPGDHTLMWDGVDDHHRTVPPGVYYARLTSGGQHASTRIVRSGR